jgi:1-acyl-sn-glycerol-3-phosphate acyltransferase
MAQRGQLYPVAKALIAPATKFIFPTRVTGLENIPRSGAAMIAPNHISFFDSVVLIGVPAYSPGESVSSVRPSISTTGRRAICFPRSA